MLTAGPAHAGTRRRHPAAATNRRVFCGVPTLYAMLLAEQEPTVARPAAHVHLRRRGAARDDARSAGAPRPGSTFSTASARPNCCTSSSATGPATSCRARPVDAYPATRCGSSRDDGKAVRRRHDRRPRSARRQRGDRLLEVAGAVGRDVPRRLGAHRRQISAPRATGHLVYCGRRDDLFKVGGIYVSPMEVENALLAHPDVIEAAVVGAEDADRLIKPKAIVVARGAPPPASPMR